MLKEIKNCISEAKKTRERRLIVLAGKERKLRYMLDLSLKILDRAFKNKTLCFLGFNIAENDIAAYLEEFKKNLSLKLEFFGYESSEDLLGTSYDILVMDMRRGIMPNDMGRVMSIVRGPGIIIMILPEIEKFKNISTLLHERFIAPPYSLADARRNFNRWLIEKLFENDGVAVIENGKVLKSIKIKNVKVGRKKLKLPEKSLFPRKIYEMCLTQNQITFLSLSEKLIEAKKGVFVLTSHRGRGKSSVLGLMLSALSKISLDRKEKITALITSPKFRNIAEVFRFFKKGCKVFGMNVKEGKEEICCESLTLKYVAPYQLKSKNSDILIVDEAAAIPINLLVRSLKVSPLVFYSTTIHGYEGCGRVFQIRFLEKLREKVSNLIEYEMITPVRYSEDDEIEKFLFRALLLDAEPPKIENDFSLEDLSYKEPKIENLLFKNEKLLREIYGIFINAHYRNNPNDFGVICDAPHHSLRTLFLKDLPIASIQLAEEGSLGDVAYEMYFGKIYSGNLIPDRVIKHYRIAEFGKLKGMRIVRIAVHHDFFDRGIGSKALACLEKELREKGYDWIGSSFGATPKLLNFWLKNGYKIVHISPMENPVTGEFSMIVIKPLSKKCEKYVSIMEREFKLKFIDSLVDPFYKLDTRLALKILKSFKPEPTKLEMTEFQWKRFFAYAFSSLTLETCRDLAYKVAKHYFLADKKPELTSLQERILIGRVLQAKDWSFLRKELKKGSVFLMIELRDIVRKLAEFYGKDKLDETEKKKMLEYREAIREMKRNSN